MRPRQTRETKLQATGWGENDSQTGKYLAIRSLTMNDFGLFRRSRKAHAAPLALLAACAGLTALTLAPSARADEWNKLTEITINEPIQVPNMVLPPGKYAMKLLDSLSDRHIVQIFNADQTH